MSMITILASPLRGDMSIEAAATQTSGGSIYLVTMALGK